MRHPHLFTALASTLLMLCIGCGPTLPSQQLRTTWVRYHYWPDDPPCEQALQALDTFVELAIRELQLPSPPPGFTIDYVKYRAQDAADLQRTCTSAFQACTRDRTWVHTTRWGHYHEATHAVLSAVGAPPDFFAEALAEMLDCGVSRWRGEAVDRSFPIETLWTASGWKQHGSTSHARTAAVAFVRFLLDSHEPALFFQLYRKLPYSASDAEVRARFAETYGVDLDAAVAQWRASPTQHEGEICRFLLDTCDASPGLGVLAPGNSTSFEFTSCVESAIPFVIADASPAVFSFAADRESRFAEIRACDLSTDADRYWGYVYDDTNWTDEATVGRSAELWTTLPIGRFALRFGHTGPTSGSSNFRISVSLRPLRVTGNCAAAVAVPIDAQTATIVVSGPADSLGTAGQAYLKLGTAQPTRLDSARQVQLGNPTPAYLLENGCNSSLLTAPALATPGLVRSGEALVGLTARPLDNQFNAHIRLKRPP